MCFLLYTFDFMYMCIFTEKRLPNWVKERIGELYQTNNDSIEEECSDDAPECSFRIEKKNLGN